MIPFQSGPPLPPGHIRAILGSAIMRQVSLGWRVETQFDNQAVMVTGGRVNHVLHLLMTVLMCGLWLPVWVILAVTGSEQRMTITVQPDGLVLFNGRPAPLGPPGGGPLPSVGDPNAQAVAAAHMRRDLRARAREQAAADPLLARELRIGRPDLLPRFYDDGGLVDVNHVPPHVLTTLCGVTPEIAEHIARIRDEVGLFSSAEELAATAGLHPDLTPEFREYGVFLP